jgi:hypothetical protein
MIYTSDILLEDIVYLVTDVEQIPRMVIAIEFSAGGSVMYTVTVDTLASRHFRCELSREVDEAKRLGFVKQEV